jgi:fucose permease
VAAQPVRPPAPLPDAPIAIARRVFAGFFLAGLLLSFLGAILPAWGHHRTENFLAAGAYFLSLNLGLLLGARLAYALMARKGIKTGLILGCSLACGGLLLLALFGPPRLWILRCLGLLLIGGGAGFLLSGLLETLSPIYERDKAVTVNLVGALFGLGCLVASLLVAGTFFVYTVPSILILLAVIPGYFIAIYARMTPPRPASENEPRYLEAVREFRNPGVVLFVLLLFFQFGNEWALAGWLPLFLILRLGLSPETALEMLAFYWLCLLVGRLTVQALLPRVPHGRFLLLSVLTAMFGCLILASTNNRFGAWSGLLFAGAGFAGIYPLVLEKIGFRFPSYRPALFNGIVAVALTGGLLANASLGFLAHWLGIGVVMWLPMAGSVMVFVLLLLVWLESKLSAG